MQKILSILGTNLESDVTSEKKVLSRNSIFCFIEELIEK